ncbi:MAG: glycosyltransferase [Acetanaerobacterium sp.]
MDRAVRLSVCMIVRDEEEFLDRCLASVKDIAYEIVVADTGSTDDSIAIAKKYGAQVYPIKWQGSFSRARNYVMSKATGDWLLLLDADEVLDSRDTDRLMEYLQTTETDGSHFTLLNYIGSRESGLYTMHNALRLLRGNGLYRFKGAIHEQITRKDGQRIPPGTFENSPIRLHHYGYLDDVVRRKQKRQRNLPLLLQELEREPDNPFFLFNLANDYLACADHEKALEAFDKAYAGMDVTQAYAPHLIYRRAVTLYNLGRYAEAIRAAAEGLQYYPECADLEYLRGAIYAEWGRYTLAIDSFVRCMGMDKPPASMRFMEDTTTLRPLTALGRLYSSLNDYPRALECYTKILEADNTRCVMLYQIAHALSRICSDKDELVKRLTGFFSDLDYLPNLILLIDVLLKECLYEQAAEYLDRADEKADRPVDLDFLRAKLCFSRRQYAQAQVLFLVVCERGDDAGDVLRGMACESAQYLFLISLLSQTDDPALCLARVNRCCCGATQRVYAQAQNVWNSNPETVFAPDENWSNALSETCRLLDKVLRAQEFKAFERLVYLLNHIDSPSVLIALAQLYRENGFDQLAVKQVLRSIKELDFINPQGVGILSVCS